jgi:hypothetical protein
VEWGRVADALGLGRVHDCQPVTGGVMSLNWRLITDAGTFAVKRLRDRGRVHSRVIAAAGSTISRVSTM